MYCEIQLLGKNSFIIALPFLLIVSFIIIKQFPLF